MKYIEKAITTPQGVQATAWVATRLEAQLFRQVQSFETPVDPFTAAQPGQITFSGWRDVEALQAGLQPLGTLVYAVADVSLLQSYAPMIGELIGNMTAVDPESPFIGGTVADVEAPVI